MYFLVWSVTRQEISACQAEVGHLVGELGVLPSFEPRLESCFEEQNHLNFRSPWKKNHYCNGWPDIGRAWGFGWERQLGCVWFSCRHCQSVRDFSNIVILRSTEFVRVVFVSQKSHRMITLVNVKHACVFSSKVTTAEREVSTAKYFAWN